MIWVPIVIALLALLRCFALERYTRRDKKRIEYLRDILNAEARREFS